MGSMMTKPVNTFVASLVILVASVLFAAVVVSASQTTKTVVTGSLLQTPPVTAKTVEPESHNGVQIVDEQLTEIVEGWAERNDGTAGIIVREVGGENRTAEYREEIESVTASTYKLFLSHAVLSEVQKGSISLNTVTSAGKTLSECFDSLLIYSEDLCAYPMGQLIGGWDKVDDFIQKQGFEHTRINNYDQSGNFTGNKITQPRDEAEFMYRLANGKLLDKEGNDFLLDKLRNQVWKERVPAGIPDGVDVASKPGWLDGYQNSAAIVYGPKTTYVIVVMTNNSSVEAIAEVSAEVYDYLNPKLSKKIIE